MRIAFIAAECEPWAKTGGLADVVDALARALGRVRDDRGAALTRPVDVYLPRYRDLDVPAERLIATSHVLVPDPTAASGVNEVGLIDVAGDGYRLRLVEHPAAFDREGYYGDARGDYPDNAWRFGLLCRTALESIRADGGTDVLHLHDWHDGPAVLLRNGAYAGDSRLGTAASLLTIHNLAYHGWVPPDRTWLLGLDLAPAGEALSVASSPPLSRLAPPAPMEAGIDLLRAGIEGADLVNTVSPTFASEALRPETGMGLDEVLRSRGERFFGILNGIDVGVWNPATDTEIAALYEASSLAGKAACRRDLLNRVGFDPDDVGIVFGAIGRLDPQKGFDLLAAAAPDIIADGGRLILQASGEPSIAEPLRALAATEPGRVAFIERFDRAMARRIYAGADVFVMPSRFEPSGQGQMLALRYGTPPLVRRTGGLADSVVDVTADPVHGTGFVFEAAAADALVEACRRAGDLRGDGRAAAWLALIARGMAADFSWESGAARRYLDAYERAIALRAGGAESGSGLR